MQQRQRQKAGKAQACNAWWQVNGKALVRQGRQVRQRWQAGSWAGMCVQGTRVYKAQAREGVGNKGMYNKEHRYGGKRTGKAGKGIRRCYGGRQQSATGKV